MGKGIVALLMILGGVGFVVVRLISTAMSKRSTQAAIDAIRKNPSKAQEIAASLDIPYLSKKDFPGDQYQKLKGNLQSSAQKGDYKILHVAPFGEDHLLIFTMLSFIDFDINMSGKATDTKKTAYHNFVVKFDREDGLQVLSTIYSDATEKFQKEGFITAIFQGV
ncbi:hypothetical protein [Chryseolinea soli]|nr:hypothetical protein [Chryseolinea soli]